MDRSGDQFNQPNSSVGMKDEKEKKEEGNLEGEAFNYDDILKHLGQIGKFQLQTVLWLCLPALFPAFVTMSLTFTGGVPDYRYVKLNLKFQEKKNIYILVQYMCMESDVSLKAVILMSIHKDKADWIISPHLG